jgi:thiosulfate/3-mercaptopyruvate sulfurtransferase
MDFKTTISVEELYSHLGDPNWAIFDVRFELGDPGQGLRQYLKGHIPGAVYAHLEDDLSTPASPERGRHPLPTIEALSEKFSGWGIDSDVQVVAYDDRGGGFAARLWWSLRYLGHDRAALLDGGLPAWIGAGLPLVTDQEMRPPRTFKANVQDGMLVQVEDVLKSIDGKDALIIDSRSPERHQGLEEPIDRLAGHIPGAHNRFWQDNLDESGVLLPKATLRNAWLDALQGYPPQETIVHCGSGVTGCFNIFSMTHAGLEGARLYAGSWSQWLEDPALPKVLGPQEEGRS